MSKRCLMMPLCLLLLAAGPVRAATPPAATPTAAAAAATPAPRAGAAPTVAAKPGKARFSVDTQIAVLMETPAAKAVLDRHFPKLAENPHYFMLEDMSIRQMAPMAQGKLTDEVLAKIDAELAQIP